MSGRPGFEDHFSPIAPAYREFRPRYPVRLFDYLAARVARHCLAWDCATGSGQAARLLAPRFALVQATDASANQLASAVWHPRIVYRRARAEASGLADASVDVVTVGQALHWFDISGFFSEVRRVLRRGGLIAVWSYGVVRVTPGVDVLVDSLYRNVLGEWWPPRRRLVDAGRDGLSVPFDELVVPEFRMAEYWTRDEFVGYLGTWSAGARCREATGTDPLRDFARDLVSLWPDAEARRTVTWPLHLRVAMRKT